MQNIMLWTGELIVGEMFRKHVICVFQKKETNAN